MKIPKQFTIFNRTYTVEWMDSDTHLVGAAHGATSLELGRVIVNNEENRECTEHTYCHELVHALLWAIGQPELSRNEEFVDLLGAAIHHYHQTKKGELKE